MSAVHYLHERDRAIVVDKMAQALVGREDIAFAYVHGSFLREEGFRDIDVALWVIPRASTRLDLELSVELSRLVGLPVDVRVVNHAPQAFLFHVFQGRPLLVRDEPLLANLIERMARSYHDAAPLARRAVREAFTT